MDNISIHNLFTAHILCRIFTNFWKHNKLAFFSSPCITVYYECQVTWNTSGHHTQVLNRFSNSLGRSTKSECLPKRSRHQRVKPSNWIPFSLFDLQWYFQKLFWQQHSAHLLIFCWLSCDYADSIHFSILISIYFKGHLKRTFTFLPPNEFYTTTVVHYGM